MEALVQSVQGGGGVALDKLNGKKGQGEKESKGSLGNYFSWALNRFVP